MKLPNSSISAGLFISINTSPDIKSSRRISKKVSDDKKKKGKKRKEEEEEEKKAGSLKQTGTERKREMRHARQTQNGNLQKE